MLIVNAGAHKSGSTWVEAIIRRLPLDLQRPLPTPPPSLVGGEYADKFAMSKIGDHRKRKIAWVEWMSAEGVAQPKYFIKCHFSPHADRLSVNDFSFLQNPDVRIVNIMRDVEDFLVSAYFHRKAYGKIDTLENYFTKQARRAFDYYIEYNHFWLVEAEGEVKCPVVNLSYEALRADFEAELLRLAGFLGVSRPYSAERVAKRTSINRMRTKYRRKWMGAFGDEGKGFYRSGVVGGYKEHLTRAMIEMVESWRREEKCVRLEAARAALARS